MMRLTQHSTSKQMNCTVLAYTLSFPAQRGFYESAMLATPFDVIPPNETFNFIY